MQITKRHLKNKKGFTLIEMLIVILIIVILLAIAVPAVAAYRREALRTQDEGAVETILTSLEAALIRETPHLNQSPTDARWAGHLSPNLDYATLAAGDATNAETDAFYKLVAEYLGPNFQGNFYFRYKDSTNEISAVFYWRSDSATQADSVMVYCEDSDISNYAFTNNPIYCDEALAKSVNIGHWILGLNNHLGI